MASPFSVFRKRQKFMMALLCILAMVSFVILPHLQDLLGGGSRGTQNPVAVETTKFGNLHASDLSRLLGNRQKIRAILTDLLVAANQNPMVAQNQVESFVGPLTQKAVVNTWLKVKCARELGMVVSNEAINQFFRDWTNNSVKAADILRVFQRTPPMSQEHIFDLMRDVLLASQLDQSFYISLYAATPSQRWDYFNRLNREATIEAIPVMVANYVKDIKDPSNEVLKTFFEEHKSTLPNPESPNPGFRNPQKVDIEFFKADVDKFLATVTDAEVQAEYEKNKDAYDKYFKISSAKESDKKEATKDAKDAEAKPESKDVKPAEKAKAPADVKEEKPKASKEPAKTEQKEPAKPEQKEPANGTSSAEKASPFKLTAMQTEKAADKATDKAAAESPAKPKTPVAKPEVPAVKAEPKAKEQPKAEEKKPAASEKKQEEPKSELTDARKLFIRQQVAFGKISKIFERLSKPMEQYQQERSKYEIRAIKFKNDKKQVSAPPVGPDFKKLAKENGLTTGQTGPVSVWGALDTEIGRSMVSMVRGARVFQYAYQSPGTFRATESQDGKSRYLFWKVSEVKETEPKLEDTGVRERVLRSWKMIEARKLAMKEAESLVEKARKAAKPLKQVFADQSALRVVLPPKFSWMTLRNVASQQPDAQVSLVAGIDLVREAFMKTVFGLEPGQVGVAFNEPQTVVYVLRPSEFTPSYDVRWMSFQNAKFAEYSSVANADLIRTVEAWLNGIKSSAGFKWADGFPDKNQEQSSEEQSTEE